jgi:hypothetical protein
MCGLAIDTTLEFDPGDDRHQHSPLKGSDFPCNGGVAVTQVDRYAGVDQERHGSEARAFGNLVFVAMFDAWRRRQRLEPRDHFGYGHPGRVQRHHVAGPDNDEFDVLIECDVLRKSDGLRIAASEGARL